MSLDLIAVQETFNRKVDYREGNSEGKIQKSQVQKSKSSNMQSWNTKKINAVFENNICKQKKLF